MPDALARLSTALADRYRIERELGAGGMATVYLAQDLKHDRKIALKVLKPELAAVLGADRFVQEIKTTAALQHPHILPLFDSGTADGFLYYVMPYIEGETLRTKLDRETQLGIDEAVKITVAVADALDYAHRHGVIHRDIKPENILLHDGRPMVADFGIALAVSAAAGGRMTETGLSLGTPHYMSPEQATAEKDITARSDIYSLGSVLYEMLAGQPPHLGGSAQQIIMRIIAEPAVEVSTLRHSVPPNVAAALMQALQKLPADRFESAKAFADALTDPHFAGRNPTAARAAGGPWRRRFYLASAVSAVLASTSLLLWLARGRSWDGANVVIAQRSFAREEILQARWAPDGQTVVYSAIRSGAVVRLYVVRPDYPEPQPFGPDSVHLLAVSSTGELAVLTHAVQIWHRECIGTLARMPLGGGAPREVVNNVFEADWSPDGARLAIIRPDTVAPGWQLEYPVGKVLYHSAPTGYLSGIRISPDGNHVAFFDHQLGGDDRGVLRLVDAAGKVSTLTNEYWGLEGVAWEPGGRAILFAGADRGGFYQIHRARFGGGVQLVLPSPGSLTVQDVTKSGDWLVTRDDLTSRLLVRAPGSPGVRDLSWLSNSGSPIISRDGKLLAFTDQSLDAGPLYATRIRGTDGSPAVRLGDGLAVALSPDGRWVISLVPTTPMQYRLYPTGAGSPLTIAWKLQNVQRVDFFPDGRHLFLCGEAPGHGRACYRSALDGSGLEQLTPDSAGGGRLRPDGGAVIYGREDAVWLRSLPDGEPRRLPTPSGGTFIRWSPDGTAFWRIADPQHVESVDLLTARRRSLGSIDAPEGIDAAAVQQVTLADDPHAYAYTVFLTTSVLFSIRGVR